MREAKARKTYIAKKKQQATAGRSMFSFLGFGRPIKSHSPMVITKRKSSARPSSHRSRNTTSIGARGTRPPRSQSARSPASSRSSARPSPRHRDSTRSYKMPGHFQLSQPQARRSTHWAHRPYLHCSLHTIFTICFPILCYFISFCWGFISYFYWEGITQCICRSANEVAC